MTDHTATAQAAMQEGERNAAAHDYFEARREIDSAEARRIFEAGFDRAYPLLSKLRADAVPNAQPAFWIDLEPISGSQSVLIRQWQNLGGLGPGKHTLYLSPAADQDSSPGAGEALADMKARTILALRPFVEGFAGVRGHAEAVALLRDLGDDPDNLAAPQASETVTAAARDVLAERRRQIDTEGFGASRDDFYTQGELAEAAACYAARLTVRDGSYVSSLWPWPAAWWKPTTYRRDLVKAGALILAEIERLDRVAPPAQPAEKKDGRDCAKDAQDERQAFEAWAGNKGWPLSPYQNNCGIVVAERYGHRTVQKAWEAWQERASAPAAGDARKPDFARAEQIAADFVQDYEWRGEDVAGRDTCHTPNKRERAMITDAILGLLAEPEFIAALAAQVPQQGEA